MGALDWETEAACRGMNPNRFFPEFSFLVEDEVWEACRRCPVQELCLNWAIEHDESGVWGGTTDEQRRAASLTQSRIRCPGCRSTQVVEEHGSEVCLSCGLSWLV